MYSLAQETCSKQLPSTKICFQAMPSDFQYILVCFVDIKLYYVGPVFIFKRDVTLNPLIHILYSKMIAIAVNPMSIKI